MIRAIRSGSAWMVAGLAAAAIAFGGCGGSAHGVGAGSSVHRLTASQEQQLLGLITRARTDWTSSDGGGARGALTQFVADVKTLRTSGRLTHATAAQLSQEARATRSSIQEKTRARQLSTGQSTGTTPATPAPVAPAPSGPADGPPGHGQPAPPKHDGHGPGHGWGHGPGQWNGNGNDDGDQNGGGDS